MPMHGLAVHLNLDFLTSTLLNFSRFLVIFCSSCTELRQCYFVPSGGGGGGLICLSSACDFGEKNPLVLANRKSFRMTTSLHRKLVLWGIPLFIHPSLFLAFTRPIFSLAFTSCFRQSEMAGKECGNRNHARNR